MTSVGSHSLEAARSAALASHSAAGLASSAGLREAARLLRSKRSRELQWRQSRKLLCGATILLVLMKVVLLVHVAIEVLVHLGMEHRSAPSAPRRPRGLGVGAARRRLPRRSGTWRSRPRVCRRRPSMLQNPRFAPAALPPRVLAAGHSRERTPPRVSSAPSRTAASSTASIGPDLRRFPVGSAVVFTGLVSRAELDGCAGTVLSFDEPSSRIAVKVDHTGESVRVQNLKKPSSSP